MFHGDLEKNNGNCLGILELLARYDPLPQEHVGNVKSTQEKGTRLQAHYFSPESQNEFIYMCCTSEKSYVRRTQGLKVLSDYG